MLRDFGVEQLTHHAVYTINAFVCTVCMNTHLPRPVAVGLERFAVVHVELRPARARAPVRCGAVAPFFMVSRRQWKQATMMSYSLRRETTKSKRFRFNPNVYLTPLPRGYDSDRFFYCQT